jgi:fucose 4-O-acetylase-like acetyltransferase
MASENKLKERTAWIDVCKGLCIVLVVYGHVSGGLETAGTLSAGSGWILFRSWIYLFHMPVFFALSGIFAYKLATLSVREFLLGRVRTVCFPYVVWTFIIVGAQFAMSRFVNNPPDVSRALRFLVEPYGYGLWFLYSLLLISVAFYFLSRLQIPRLAMILAAIVLSFLASRNVFGFWPILNSAMSFFIYYAAAACARERIVAMVSGSGWGAPLIFGAGLLLAMTGIRFAGPGEAWPLNVLLAGLGFLGMVCLAKVLAHTPACRFWAFLGLFSLEIYLGHPLWGTVSRVVLLRSGMDSPAVMVLGGVLLGIAGSLLVGVLCRAWDFPYLFKWPAKRAAKCGGSQGPSCLPAP